jgi:hypothetical protein
MTAAWDPTLGSSNAWAYHNAADNELLIDQQCNYGLLSDPNPWTVQLQVREIMDAPVLSTVINTAWGFTYNLLYYK